MLKYIKNVIQKILGIGFVRGTFIRVNIIVLGAASFNRLFSIIYHFFFFFLFSREQHANIKGKYHYYRNLKNRTMSKSPLRRNIHRLEKGLIMRPLRDVFALEYIEETVKLYEEQAKNYQQDPEAFDKSELEWAHDVLKRYFATVKKNPFLIKLEERFKLVNFETEKDIVKAPFKRGKHTPASVSYEDLLALSLRRRSVRWFLQKPVPRELIDKALLIARQSPSACNRLPYEFRFYDDPELVKKVASLPFGAGGYSHNIPTIAVLVGKQSSYFSARDRHVIYIDTSLAAMAFMFALETLGLASSPINWPDFEPLEAKMQKTLGMEVDERPIMLMAIGYADPKGEIPYSQKKSLDAMRSYNAIGSSVYK